MATIETGRSDGVLTLRMNRPDKKNALDRAMYAALSAALRQASESPEIGAAVIAGVPGAFSAGNDIRDFADFAASGRPISEIADFLHALAGFDKPLIAAVDGLAIGIGTTMLMHCDLVLASPQSVFRTPFLDLGLVPEAGSSLIAPRLMGHQAAFALLVSGDTFSAAEAKDACLVYRIVPSQVVEAQALDAARKLAAKPREALRIARDLVRGPRDELLERIAAETRHFEERLRSADAKAAFGAFAARR